MKMVTVRELVVLGGSVTSHLKSVRRPRHLHGLASHERYTVFTVKERETIPTSLPATGLKLGRRRDKRALYVYAVASSDWQIAIVTN